VAIARALVGPRRLVLADEPTGALDSTGGEQILRVLRTRVDAGAAGLLVTHDPRHAAWADRVVFLRDGVIVDAAVTDGPERLLQVSGSQRSEQ
jgi:putative ABC transport system ATP-binding protein